MNNAQLAKRVNDLAEKLKLVPSEGIRIDFDSFTEPEKYVLLKNRALDDKYGNRIPDEIFEENKDLIFKANDIALKRTSELFEFIVPRALMLDKVEQWFFNLHFRIFWKNLKECLENVRKWSKDEKEEFLSEDWGRFEFKKEKDS